MARDTDRFIYVEVALPRSNEAIQNMVAEAEAQSTPLRVLVKQACIKVYSGDFDEPQQLRKKPERPEKPKSKVVVSEEQAATANAFLDEGF